MTVTTHALALGLFCWFPGGIGRSELEWLSREELIERVLRLQRPEKTSHTSSKPPSTDRKERREQSKPGGAKPGHEGHSRAMSETPDEVVEHCPDRCACCGGGLCCRRRCRICLGCASAKACNATEHIASKATARFTRRRLRLRSFHRFWKCVNPILEVRKPEHIGFDERIAAERDALVSQQNVQSSEWSSLILSPSHQDPN